MTDQFAHLPGVGRLEHRLDLIAQRVRHAVLPLFKPDGRRKPELVGCSVAFEAGGRYFLLTARHVVVDLKMNDFHVWTPEAWILAHGQIARTDPQGRAGDPFDAAVIRLDAEFVNEHLRRHALRVRDLDVAFPSGPRQYLMQLIGYPGGTVLDVGDMTLSPTWFQWAGVGVQEKEYAKRGKKLKSHVIFHFDRAGAFTRDGEKHPGPDMHGASGGGIWRMLPEGEDIERERWALLTGIFTEYEGRTISGTRITAHLALIAKYFPEATKAA